ncbi:MAG TPA: hypothetical protein VMQ44_03455 [Candidatus Saccharimonadales bacterium]|nr:hypothetical protein [Candidatus Saccharimonadales bacterium]
MSIRTFKLAEEIGGFVSNLKPDISHLVGLTVTFVPNRDSETQQSLSGYEHVSMLVTAAAILKKSDKGYILVLKHGLENTDPFRNTYISVDEDGIWRLFTNPVKQWPRGTIRWPNGHNDSESVQVFV